MTTAREAHAGIRTVLEVPIMTERYWAKVPTSPADAIMVDLEDSAPPALKPQVRQRVLEALRRPEQFGTRLVIVRVNNLSTPWGEDDLAALADAPGDFLVSYPKASSGTEVADVVSALGGPGSRGVHAMIETASAVVHLNDIASTPGVVGLHFGYVDYAADVGSRPYDDDGSDLYGPANHWVRSAISVTAAAHGLFATGGSLVPDHRDLDKVRRFVRTFADTGYTACIAVSPAHLPLIAEVMTPSEAEMAGAGEICDAYEESLRRGDPAALVGGRVVTLPDYRVARLVLTRGGRPRPVVAGV